MVKIRRNRSVVECPYCGSYNIAEVIEEILEDYDPLPGEETRFYLVRLSCYCYNCKKHFSCVTTREDR